jgi:plastocyanin
MEVHMSIHRRSILGVAAVLVVSAALPAAAQTACVTPNCVFAGKPATCVNRAEPSTPTVLMTQSGLNFVFDPSNPKIEPGGCIIWKATEFTHSSSGNGCTDDSLCGSPAPPACQWDAGNVDSLGEDPTSTCSYDAGTFPAGTGNAYYCRIHATPTTGTMRGTLRVTTPIALKVDKDLATNSVKLTWTGGGVTGDFTYKVARNTGGDPLMPAATTPTLNPDAGVAGTIFTDTGDLTNPATRYYLVRNKQTNEP